MNNIKSPEQENIEMVPGNHTGIAHEDVVETYGDGSVSDRHGGINRWLLVVYVGLFIWSLYYGYTYWGGLGPGLDY
tara:strand:+ start:5308 stop:5535 length:228 start_codon:yes stop_codon:yes gene_type:complete